MGGDGRAAAGHRLRRTGVAQVGDGGRATADHGSRWRRVARAGGGRGAAGHGPHWRRVTQQVVGDEWEVVAEQRWVMGLVGGESHGQEVAEEQRVTGLVGGESRRQEEAEEWEVVAEQWWQSSDGSWACHASGRWRQSSGRHGPGWR